MKFNYYYGSQADQFSFIRIPKIMLTDSVFQELSMAAKVLYGVLLDRMNLSMKNGWLDEEKRVYIIYQIGEIQEDLGFSKKKAMDLLTELEVFGLLQKKRRGHGLPNILYVKNFMAESDASGAEMSTSGQHREKETEEEIDAVLLSKPDLGDEAKGSTGIDTKKSLTVVCSRSADMVTSDQSEHGSRGDGIRTQAVTKSALLEVPDPAPLKNQTNINNTYKSNTESNLIVSTESQAVEDTMRRDEKLKTDDPGIRAKLYRQIIRENINYDDLLISHADDAELIEGIADLILETVIGRQNEILVAGGRYPAEMVRSRFLKLNYFHIEYVLRCLKQNTTKVKNIRKYLLAALFNAPSTMDGYYQAEVNHDMPQYAR